MSCKLTVQGSTGLNLGLRRRTDHNRSTAQGIDAHNKDTHPTAICIAHPSTDKNTWEPVKIKDKKHEVKKDPEHEPII
jgi:hypothetical protein